MNEFDAFADELHAIMVGKVDPTEFGSKHGLCRFNTSINCMESDCSRCGWNPVVTTQRLEAIKEKLGVTEDGEGKPSNPNTWVY